MSATLNADGKHYMIPPVRIKANISKRWLSKKRNLKRHFLFRLSSNDWFGTLTYVMLIEISGLGQRVIFV